MAKYGPEQSPFSSTTSPSELNRAIRSGDPNAWSALEMLSRQALGGNTNAQSLVNQIDQDVSLGLLKMPSFPKTTILDDDTDISFFLSHPLLAFKIKMKQIMVGLDHELPPHTSTIEQFPTLTLWEAYTAISKAGDIPEHHNE